jgi:hypothetical protein
MSSMAAKIAPPRQTTSAAKPTVSLVRAPRIDAGTQTLSTNFGPPKSSTSSAALLPSAPARSRANGLRSVPPT